MRRLLGRRKREGVPGVVCFGGGGAGGGPASFAGTDCAYALLVVFDAASDEEAKQYLGRMFDAMPPCVYELSRQGWRFHAPFRRLETDLGSWLAGGGKGTILVGSTAS